MSIQELPVRVQRGLVEEAILLAEEDGDVGLERIAYEHCVLAEIHSRQADHFYRLAERHRAGLVME